MLSALHNWFRRVLTWRVLGLLVVAFLLCQLGFVLLWWQFALPDDLPDLRFGYGPEELRDRFDHWGDHSRRTYVATVLTLDTIVPVVYAILYAGCTVRLLGDRSAPWVILPGVAAGLADLAENVPLAYLAWTHDGRASWLAWVASAFTIAKALAAVCAIGLLLFAGLVAFRRAKSGSQR